VHEPHGLRPGGGRHGHGGPSHHRAGDAADADPTGVDVHHQLTCRSVTESIATMALMLDQVPSAATRTISASKSTAGGSVFTHCGVSHALHTALIRRPEHQVGRLTQAGIVSMGQ
jgi:hypothetical protein